MGRWQEGGGEEEDGGRGEKYERNERRCKGEKKRYRLVVILFGKVSPDFGSLLGSNNLPITRSSTERRDE